MPTLPEIIYRITNRKMPISFLSGLLGNPKSILCIANGPSCAEIDPESLDFDCVLRVNPISSSRLSFLENVQPDLIMMSRIPKNFSIISNILSKKDMKHPIILVRGRKGVEAANKHINHGFYDAQLLDFWHNNEITRFYSHVWRNRLSRKRYITTNGAMMVAIAAALNPQKITITGLDLYSHSSGDYSNKEYSKLYDGSVLDLWAKTGGHAIIQDIYVILRALKREYKGEVIAIGDPLNYLLNHPKHDRLSYYDSAKNILLNETISPYDNVYEIMRKV